MRSSADMNTVKMSETVKLQLEAVKAEYEAAVQKMVYQAPGRTAENHDALWMKFWRECGGKLREREQQLEFELCRELNREMEVGDGATICLWSDREACTVVRRTAKTLVVQRDKAIRDPEFKPEWVPGGFSAICTNCEEQRWTYERDPNGATTRFHWSEKFGGWQAGSDGSIKLARGRHEYYDYNF